MSVSALDREIAYEVAITKVVSARLGGGIFAGTVTAPFGDPKEGNQIRIVVPGRVLHGAGPVEGETWHVVGGWAENGGYGQQFHAQRAYRARPSGRLIVSYLAHHVPGIGQGRANRLWDVFGERLPEMLDAGEIARLAEVIAPRFPALSVRLAADIVTQWKEATVEPAIIAWLDALGITDTRFVQRVIKILGEKTRPTLEANPYILAVFLDRWKRVDELGQRLMAEAGITDVVDHPNRLVGAVDYVVRRAITDDGHTLIDEETLRLDLARCFGGQPASRRVTDAIRLGEINNAIIPHRDGVWRAPGCAALEDGLLKRFSSMLVAEEPTDIAVPSRSALERVLGAFDELGTPLHAEQRGAVLQCLTTPLAVLTGGAGVGKTTTVRAVVHVWETLGGRVEMVALAGKAALRMSQATGRLARTIHRFLKELEVAAERHDAVEDRPLLDTKTLLVVDEASMVDLGQWHRLVCAMPPGCRLLMVGDVGQLPPIGFGLVFHLLAQVPRITVELKTVHRQSEDGGIPAVARSIRTGVLPNLKPFTGLADGVFLVPCAKADIASEIDHVVSEFGGFGTDHAVQIVAPTNRDEVGVDGLCARFHERHRSGSRLEGAMPAWPEVEEVKGFLGNAFCVNEPVIHRRNDYQRGLFNGSLGHVVSINTQNRSLVARFDGVKHEFVGDELIDLSLAYALTCHRLQGSQAERIVVVLLGHPMVDPSWLYTAVTRAENQVVLVGDPTVLDTALKRPPAWKRRRVGFEHFLHMALGQRNDPQ